MFELNMRTIDEYSTVDSGLGGRFKDRYELSHQVHDCAAGPSYRAI